MDVGQACPGAYWPGSGGAGHDAKGEKSVGGSSFASWVFAMLVLVLAVVGSMLYLSPRSGVSESRASTPWSAVHPVGLEQAAGHHDGMPRPGWDI